MSAAPTTTGSDRSAPGAVGVVIVDDDDAIRTALAALIDDRDGLRVLAALPDGLGLADVCAEIRPDVAVVDVAMPGGGVAAIAAIRSTSPRTRIVVYTARSDGRTRRQMIAAGADRVVAKGGDLDIADELAELVGADRGAR